LPPEARPCPDLHFINSYTESNTVHVDIFVSDVPAFAFKREADGLHFAVVNMTRRSKLQW
jgi:hypothetical protein